MTTDRALRQRLAAIMKAVECLDPQVAHQLLDDWECDLARTAPPEDDLLEEVIKDSGLGKMVRSYKRRCDAALSGYGSLAIDSLPDPIMNADLAKRAGLGDADGVSKQIAAALHQASVAVPKLRNGQRRHWTHKQLRAAFPHLGPRRSLWWLLYVCGFDRS